MNENFVVRQRKGRVIALFITSLIFILIGWSMIHSHIPHDVVRGWFGIIFFGLCAIILLIELFRSVLLQVDSQGVFGYHHGWNRLRVPTEAILSTKVGANRFALYVLIEYIDNGRCRKAYFPLFSTKATVDELVNALHVIHPRQQYGNYPWDFGENRAP